MSVVEEKLTGKVEALTDLSQQINETLTQQITTRITEAQEKITFDVVRKTAVGTGQTITFDNENDAIIANIGASMALTQQITTQITEPQEKIILQ